MKKKLKLETKRLLLSRFQDNDLQAVFACCSNPNVSQFTSWNTHKSIEDSKKYIAAAEEIGKIDKNAFFCTVQGHITFTNVVNECVKRKIKNVYIIPFMSVAGDHAHNDMYEDKPGSLKNLLKDKGINSEIVMKGLGENRAISRVWLDHLEEAINSQTEEK